MLSDKHPPRDKIPRIASSLDLDPRLMKEFPPGSKCIESVVYGTAAWTNAQRITLELPDGTQQSFFLKVGPPCTLSRLPLADNLFFSRVQEIWART